MALVSLHLCEVAALGYPAGGGPHAQHHRRGHQRVELGVELRRDVEAVAEDAQHQAPLDPQPPDEEAGQEAGGEDEAGVHGGVGPRAQVGHLLPDKTVTRFVEAINTPTELMEDWSFDMDSYAVNSSRKLMEMRRTFL